MHATWRINAGGRIASSLVFRYFTCRRLHAQATVVNRFGMEPLRSYIRVPYARSGYPGGLEDEEVVGLGFLLGVGLTVVLGYTLAILWKSSMVWLGLFGMPLGFIVLACEFEGPGRRP